MFTPGFRYFFGLAIFGLIGAFVYGLSSGDASGPDYFGFVDRRAIVGLLSLGWKGDIGSGHGYVVLVFLTGAAALVALSVVAFRDADVESVAELSDSKTVPPGQRATAPSYWPLTSGLGLGVLMLGLALGNAAVWIGGLVLLVLVGAEWAFSSWADRATGSAEINSVIKSRVLAPIEIPILSVAALAVIAIAISRILLAVSVLGAVVVAGVVALVVFLIAILAATRPNIGRKTIGAVVGVTAAAIIALGIISEVVGPREIHHDESHGESVGHGE